MSSNPSSSKRGPRGGGGGRGRGRGGGGRRSGRGRSNKRSGDRSSNSNGTNAGTNSNDGNQALSMPEMRDEEILIGFMPYLKGDNQEATAIHERYQSNNDQQAFLRAARDFLSGDGKNHGGSSSQTMGSIRNFVKSSPNSDVLRGTSPHSDTPRTTSENNESLRDVASPDRAQNHMEALERNMASLLSDDDDPVIRMPIPFNGGNESVSAIGGTTIGPVSSTNPIGSTMYSSAVPIAASPNHIVQDRRHQALQLQQFNQPAQQRQPMTPPRGLPGLPGPNNITSQSPFSSLFPSSTPDPSNGQAPFFHQQQQPEKQQQQKAQGQRAYSPQPPLGGAAWGSVPPPGLMKQSSKPAHLSPNRSPMLGPATSSLRPSTPASDTHLPSATPAETPKMPTRKEYQPKRLWTRLEEQPGKILANNVPASMSTVVDLRPRQELKAQWALPLPYLRQHAAGKANMRTVRDLLQNLAVGLFRRGCTENGAQASIVSKEILTPAGESRSDYTFQVINDAVVGTVPFYSPRTPGHVVLRLYWQNEPLRTLATGPTLNVRVTENDFESSIRFILSNFKAKKVNPTSLSSLNSLALVLEQFQLMSTHPNQAVPQQLEGAGRAVWGCICEARKVLDSCASEYHKTTSKLQKLEEVVDDLKAKVEEEEKDSKPGSDDANSQEENLSENTQALREKQKTLMSGRASCERKWRDSQLAFSSILKAVVTNPSMSVILRRELVTKLRLEYELWCPLSEEFAVPGDVESKMWYEPLASLPHSVSADHFRYCNEARSKMQQRSLGFDPNIDRLDSILYPSRGRNRQMNPSAVNVFNQLSSAMGQLYQDNYATADRILQQRDMIRIQTEKCVSMCECFPPGTRVAVFGSSANGFGSPKSDLDMCLQIPQGHSITDDEDPTGANKMSKLAQVLEENGMIEVDTARLTARIPVIKFNCPRPMHDASIDEDATMECDLSMNNPLAVLNTSLLRTYAEINPVPRVLAGVIKRWAKARDINNPARHTLSSYGYILMLLHFLTFHERSGDGLVSSFSGNDKPEGGQRLPLLPNLQWMDGRWVEMQSGTPYKESATLPKKMMQHPLEDRGGVNTYFYRPDSAMLQNLQRLFPGQDLSLGILLASFFRYYAYEFDYKRFVVSLHSTVSNGLVEREVKAELDGWRNYSAALTIEDPFETFYDVAHVLRGGYYHRIRREFAVAYSKIADVASGKTTSTWNNKTIDLTKMVGMELIEWICEPVVSDRDDVSSQR